MMTAVMIKADTRPASRGSNVGGSWTIVAANKRGGETQMERLEKKDGGLVSSCEAKNRRGTRVSNTER